MCVRPLGQQSMRNEIKEDRKKKQGVRKADQEGGGKGACGRATWFVDNAPSSLCV